MAIVNVKDFGAIGDGVTDDTTAFLSALDMLLNTFETGYLYCPSGTYKLTQQLVIDKPFVGIKGDGIQATDLSFSGDGIQLSSNADFSLAVIEGLTISGPGPGVGASVGISMPNSNFYFLRDFYVASFDIGINASTAVLSKFTDFSVNHCRIGAQFTDSSYAVTVINGNVRNCEEAGIIALESEVYIFDTDIEDIHNGPAIIAGDKTTIRDCHIESSTVGISISEAGQVRVDGCYIGGCETGVGQPASTFFNGFYSFKNLIFVDCTQELDIDNISYYQIEDTTCLTATGGGKAITTMPPQEYGVVKGLAYDPGNSGYFVSYKAAGILVNGKNVLTANAYQQNINFGTIPANSSQQFDFYEVGAFSEWAQMLLWSISSYEIPLGLTFTVFVKPSSVDYVRVNVTNTTGSAITVGSRLFMLRTI